MISVVILILSFVPAALLYFYLRGVRKGDKVFEKDCLELLLKGALCSCGVFLLSLVLTILFNVTGLYKISPLLTAALKTFFVFAFSEEFIKHSVVKKKVSKRQGKVSWLMLIAFGGIVGLGFHILESCVYALSTNAVQMIVRGLTLGHGAYGMLMGYYMGKYMHTGDKKDSVNALLIPMLIHGMYDFSLAEEFQALNDNLVFVPFIIVGIELFILFRMIFTVKKERNNPVYASIPNETEADANAENTAEAE